MRRWYAAASAVLGGAILFFLFLPWYTVLAVSSTGEGKLLLLASLERGEEFTLSYVHSVNKRPVFDTLRIEKDYLVIVRSRFDAFGAGMPEQSYGTMRLDVAPDGTLVWTVNRRVPEVALFVGRVAGHALEIRGRKILLATLAAPGTSVTLRPLSVSLVTLLKGRWGRE